jgi:hypothetical protein
LGDAVGVCTVLDEKRRRVHLNGILDISIYQIPALGNINRGPREIIQSWVDSSNEDLVDRW